MAPFEFVEPPQAEGEWVSLREIAKMGEVVTVGKGFLIDDDANTYAGQPAPRFIVVSSVKSTGDAIKTGVAKGYGRDQKLAQLAAYLEEHPDETVDIEFFKPKASSAYVDVKTA